MGKTNHVKQIGTVRQDNGEFSTSDVFVSGLILGIVISLWVFRRFGRRNKFRGFHRRKKRGWIAKIIQPHKKFVEGGYIKLLLPSGEYQFEHRLAAEKVLQRKLTAAEVVHHINGKTQDNAPENLCVMSRRNHDRYHEWYDWIVKTYEKYPRLETSKRKLRKDFDGQLLSDVIGRKSG